MAGAKSDKLYQLAKQNFVRKPTNKSPRDRILIVCEGKITEPRYFKSLCNELRLTSTEVKICGEECGSAPSSVYEYTIQELKRDGDYDRAYCVFDKDNHESYVATLDAIKRNKEFNIKAANSVPCFEFWVLLYFENTSRPFKNSDEVAKSIKKHWKEYDKDKIKNLYPHLQDKTGAAIKNTKIVIRNGHGDNPSTQVHILVEDLINQGRK